MRCEPWESAAVPLQREGGPHSLLQDDVHLPLLAQDLQFAVLQTLPLASTPREVVEHRRHKAKLGSRAHG
jgi:hypothetical protein